VTVPDPEGRRPAGSSAPGAEPDGATEAALKQSLSLLRATLDATADGVLVVDTERRITGYNQRFLSLWRVPQSLLDLGDAARLMHHVLDQLTDPEGFLARLEAPYLPDDGVSFDTLHFKDGRSVERYSLPQRVDGVTVGRVSSFRDVSGLTVILGRAELARDSIDDEAIVHESLREISEAGRRGSDLVRKIREFSQKHPPERGPIAVGAAIGQTLQRLRGALPGGVDLEANIDPAVVVQASAAQLQQMITNLVVNAGHAIGEAGGRITVTLELVPASDVPDATPTPPEDRYACLTVADTGCGMAPEMVSRIFEPFFSTRRGGHGAGLGLALVHGIVRRHNWTITVESTVGEGATFRVFCPAMTGPALATRSAPGADHPLSPGDSCHVLVVDDEPGIVSVVATSLRRLGYRVTACTDPREGLAAFRAEPHAFDVVLTDLSMPHMSGLDLGRSLLDVRADVPIVLFTGFNADLSADDARTAGFRALLSKPITPTSLADVLHLARRQQT
jgi:signal transduction histidine kinase